VRVSETTPSELAVLLVGDTALEAQLIQEMLSGVSRPITVTHVAELREAFDRLRGGGFHAVLLDLSLPDSEGLETFVRAQAEVLDVPIVVLTGLADDEVAARTVRAGAQDYLVKGRVDGPLLYQSIRFAVERHASEAALRRSEARYRSLIEGSIQGILIHVDGIVRVANPALYTLLGLRPDEPLVGRAIWPFIAPDDRALVAEDARARRQGEPAPSQYQFRAVRRDGTLIWLECIVTTIAWDGEPALLATVVDVTERKRAEEDLRASEQRFRQMAENIKEAFIVVELPSNRPLYLSRMWEEISGRSIEPDHADSRPWTDAIHPDDRASVHMAQNAIERGEPVSHTFRIVRPDGSVRWARARTFPVRDTDGHIYRLVGLVEDITEIKLTEQQLLQAQKMEAVGRLAGGIAHDFNNLLTAINGYAELVVNSLGPDHPATPDVQQIHSAGRSAETLTRQLLAFSRRQILQPQIIDLNRVVQRAESLLRRVIGEDITLLVKLTTPLARVNADPGQIEQVIMNLVVNARDALKDGGALTIETANVTLDKKYAARHPGATAGPHVMVAVSDTGTGMDEATQKRLFEPFFTTKELGKGTGLGLAMVYGIVKQSRGSIWVYSEPGHGSTFKMYLPVVQADTVERAPAVDAVPATLSGTETVLVVEDQAEARSVMREILSRRGYIVIEAISGSDAVMKSRQHPGAIDLLLTDVVMPGLSGRGVADILQAERPNLRVIYMSGYTDEAIVHHGILDSGLAFIQKPFTADAFLRKIRQVLDLRDPTPL
jgi:two-component system, cell cycle sensor histidine kinase and response regulator CckA